MGVMIFRSARGCPAQVLRDIEADVKDEVLYSKTLTFPSPLDLNQLNDAWGVDVAWTLQRFDEG